MQRSHTAPDTALTIPSTKIAYIAIGSNIAPLDNIAEALDLLQRLPQTRLTAQSPWYRTRPWGLAGQDEFINLAVALATELPPHRLLAATQEIEARLNRIRRVRNGPRTIDLDILLYGARVIDEPALSIPHPGLLERDFMLIPLLDIAPGIVHPVTGKPLASARAHLPFCQIIAPLPASSSHRAAPQSSG